MPQPLYYNSLQIFNSSHLEQISEFVLSLGIDAIEYKDNGIIVRSEDELDTVKWGVEEFTKKLSQALNMQIDVSFKSSKESNIDWIEKYKQSIKPLEVGGFYIRPSWEESKKGLIDIIIDPALAFGSGHHESTYTCIQALEKYVNKNDKVLDVGCGSGILSIVSAKLGGIVDSCDTDEQAVQSTNENQNLNNVKLNKTWIGSAGLSSQTYDVVVANIIADIIITISDDLNKVLKPNATLILSGILEKYEKIIMKKFNNLKHIQTFAKNEWQTIIFKKGVN